APFRFSQGPVLNIRFCAHRHVGGRDGPATSWNDSCRGAQRAVRRDVQQRSIGPRAGNLLAGAGALRHAAGLPKALRGLHGNGLLDRDAGAKVRIREALRRRRPTAAALRASVPIPKFASLCRSLVCELRNRRTLATYWSGVALVQKSAFRTRYKNDADLNRHTSACFPRGLLS